MKTERWRTSLHEAGHGVCAIVLGGRCTGVALLDDGESGIAEASELLGNRAAYFLAAGAAAERLVDQYEVPEVAITQAVVRRDNFEELPIFQSSRLLASQLVSRPDKRRDFESDNRQLALWSILGNEDDPESWARRVAHAHEMAAEIVRHNATAIVKIAEKLFIQGSLSENEIRSLYESDQDDLQGNQTGG